METNLWLLCQKKYQIRRIKNMCAVCGELLMDRVTDWWSSIFSTFQNVYCSIQTSDNIHNCL